MHIYELIRIGINMYEVSIARLKSKYNTTLLLVVKTSTTKTTNSTISAVLDGVKFYFPAPHHPWARGTNENTNGLLREYFPTGKDLTGVSAEYTQAKIDKFNQRPRKCLGYLTPYKVYFTKMLHLA